MSSQEENIPPVTDGDSQTTQSSKTKRINNINYGGKRLKKCVECDQFALSNRSAKCPNGHPFRIKRKPVEAPPGSTCVTTVDRDLKKSVKTLNEHHHWHIVTLRAKRHKNGLEFRYEGTEGFGENFIEDPTINSAIKRAFEPRFKRAVSTAKVFGCNINSKFFQKTVQLSSCLFCDCNVDANETRHTVCSNCPSKGDPISVDCPFCQHPFNTSIRIDLGNTIDISTQSKCVSCQCTKKGKVICQYAGFKDPICCDQDCPYWKIKRYPKEKCTHCIAPFTREKKMPGEHWFMYNPDYLACNCLKNGYLVCFSKRQYTSVGSFKQIRFSTYTMKMIEELFQSPDCNSPAKSLCPSGMSFRWRSSYCLLKCDPNRRQPVFMKMKKRWCEHVIQNDGYCTPCDGDRDSFLEKHNGSLTVCNRTKELLWKSSLCNRVIECSDKEDEINCPKGKMLKMCVYYQGTLFVL
ncbi:uncharacterized protein [Clytia hemisphaerica]|uniref:uncharacterized protein isoform X2 n=1 Tax=Clytia hemisphaerica TaxID=252671 RepID=UPI0034D4B925